MWREGEFRFALVAGVDRAGQDLLGFVTEELQLKIFGETSSGNNRLAVQALQQELLEKGYRLDSDIISLASVQPGVYTGGSFGDVFMVSSDRDPNQRWASADDLVQALHGEALVVPRRRRRVVPKVVSTIAGAAVVGAALFLAFQRFEQAAEPPQDPS
ncbi:MAG: hypothetical protein IH849_15045, partial [Acidobacteria bacterium]|nr:hypothetical protein [Acidobacteriota bacterium]